MSNYKRQQPYMKISFSKQPDRYSIHQIESEEEDRYQNGRKRVKNNKYEGESHQSISSNSSGVIRFEVENEKSITEKDLAPWLTKSTRGISDTLLRFHNQIIEFYNYIKPSKKAHSLRMKKFNFIKEKVQEMFPKVQVIPFGSFATQLYLPDGDIDISVLTNGQYDTLQVYNKINKYLCSRSNANLFTNVEYIRKSKVPLIKFNYENIHFDISVDKSDGIHQIKYVEKINAHYPEFKYLTFVFKCTLRIRGQGDTYTGGIGSFLLACLILVYLVNTQRSKNYYNLGEHVIQFMKFYTFRDDDWWEKRAVHVKDGLISQKRVDGTFFSCLSPQDDTHDIGKSAYKIRQVFKVLKNRCNYILDKNFAQGESILRVLVNPHDESFKYSKQHEE